MAQQPVDYDRLAKEHGGTPVASDYDALAEEVRRPETTASPTAPSAWEMLKDTVQGQSELGTGFGKRAIETIVNLGELVHKVPGVSDAIDAFYGTPGLSRAAFQEAEAMTRATTPAQHVGKFGEQMAEVLVPGAKVAQATRAWSLPARMAAEGAFGATTAAVQKGDPTTGAVVGAAGPVVGVALGPMGRWVESKAIPLMRAGLKTPLSLLKQQAGVSAQGLDFA